MSSHVTSYKQRIEDLEAAATQQDNKIKQLEASEERLRAALRNSSRTSDGERISDLLDRLIQTENSELKLKERVWNLEKNEKELQIKVLKWRFYHRYLYPYLKQKCLASCNHRFLTLTIHLGALISFYSHLIASFIMCLKEIYFNNLVGIGMIQD